MDIDEFLPQWLTDRWESLKNYQADCWESLKNYQADCWESLKNCQAVHRYKQAKEFSHSHPVIAMFLAIVFGFGFLPVIVFLSFVFGSFVVIFFTALTVFQGVLVVSLVPFLTVAVPILMFGGVVAVFVYIAYCCVVKIRRIIKRFKEMFQSKLPSRINGKRIRFVGHKVKTHATQQLNYNYAFPPSEEETFVDELFYSSPDCFWTKLTK